MTPTARCALMLAVLALPVTDCLAAGRTPKASTPSSQSDKSGAPQTSEAYDPAATTMTVLPSAKGATQRVVANNSSDAKQIGLVRLTLKRQADDAAAGNFPTPSKARDNSTPGLAALQAAAPGQINAQYFEIRSGGEIRYTTDDPALMKALSAWLDAQLDIQATAAAASSTSPGTAH